MCLHIDSPPCPRYGRVVRRILRQGYPHKAPQRQRIRQTPGDPTLAVDTLKIADEQRPDVNAWGQRRPPILQSTEDPIAAPVWGLFVRVIAEGHIGVKGNPQVVVLAAAGILMLGLSFSN